MKKFNLFISLLISIISIAQSQNLYWTSCNGEKSNRNLLKSKISDLVVIDSLTIYVIEDNSRILVSRDSLKSWQVIIDDSVYYSNILKLESDKDNQLYTFIRDEGFFEIDTAFKLIKRNDS
ncbi:MAG: hypothetical protein QG635_1783, partial [Bacteroidota bacterium]|nr:hypothetical protein [Bacteroidota bacterium]